MELLSAWAPLQPWGSGLSGSALDIVGAYRFDDPEGEVGIETHLLRSAEGQVVQVPVTYRGAPVPEAEAALIATTQHSVLGQRWVYDGCGDPAYVAALATAILTGGTEADLDVVTESGHERRPATTKVTGSGAPGSAVPPVGPLTYRHEGGTTVVRSGALELRIFRVIDLSSTAGIAGVCVLMGTWPGQGTPALLASVPAGPIPRRPEQEPEKPNGAGSLRRGRAKSRSHEDKGGPRVLRLRSRSTHRTQPHCRSWRWLN